MHDTGLWAKKLVRAAGMGTIGAVAILAGSLMSGCNVGPNYQRPKVQIPAAFHAPAEIEQREAPASSFADLPWWKVFQDPQLQA